jgi:hypothetical protein
MSHLLLSERHESIDGPGTAQREPAWMDALSQLFLLYYDGNESEPRSTSQPIAYRGEAKEAPWL